MNVSNALCFVAYYGYIHILYMSTPVLRADSHYIVTVSGE